MPRQAAVTVENNFKNGLVTEASSLNFPEAASTDTYNCVFNSDGSVDRRLGFEFELDNTTKTIAKTDRSITTYLWKNVAGNGDVTLLVVQVGAALYFYETATDGGLSSGAVASSINLATYSASGAPTPETQECQYSSGNGLLFVTHPYCETFYVSYNTATDTATATQLTLKIRDFEGDTADPHAVDLRPTTAIGAMNVSHYYNLLNQGWNVTNLNTWDAGRTDMPSNCDIMWAFKNSSDAFDITTVANVMAGNSPAPKGHYVMTLSNQNRDSISGLTGTTATTTSYQRPTTSAFFAGRVFYAGINYIGFNSKIFFTQIVERTEQYAFCYQLNDPTAEDAFDLLPSDGGVISIPEAGTIVKLFTVAGGLVVFAANGVWFISGSTGLGFTANDYTVQKISSIATLTAASFVDVAGYPAWWNGEGIYILTNDQGNPTIQSLTDAKIKSFYNDIPFSSKSEARGYYNSIAGVIQWLYNSTEAATLTERHQYDRILNFNTQTGAFYPWSMATADVKINAVIVLDANIGAVTTYNVQNDAGDNIVDDSGNQVISYSSTTLTTAPSFKYLVSYPSGANNLFTFAETNNDAYVDWAQQDSTAMSSYFVTGYKLRGEGIRKFQSNWVKVFSYGDEPTSFHFQGMWDYATTGSATGRWSSRQYVNNTLTNHGTIAKRLKVRGHGVALQFRVTSIAGQPFSIVGWSTLDTVNSLP